MSRDASPVERIVSGGQTGADRGALDAAIALGLAHGGWCPRGRRAEDGAVPARYAVRETRSAAYAERTEKNVVDSDGTLLITRGPPTGGSALTARLARRHRRPLCAIDLAATPALAAVTRVRGWLAGHAIARLNVAGPRHGHDPRIGDDVRRLLVAALRPRLRLGAHTSIAGGLHLALTRGADSGCDVVQIFTRSNQQWAEPPLGDDRLTRWAAARAGAVEPAMVHVPYLCNLASHDRRVRDRSSVMLAAELRRAARLGIPYVVVHPGSHGGAGERVGLRRIAAALDRIDGQLRGWQAAPGAGDAPAAPPMVLLECTAGQGTSLGWRFEHLRDLLGAVRDPDRLGVCLDTCHLLAAGHDLRTPEAWAATFDRFERLVGCARVHAFHVNDSKVPLGARVDRHQHLGRGHLGLGGFHCLVNDPRFVGLPMVIETPRAGGLGDPINLGILRALHGRVRIGRRARALAATPLGPPPGRARATPRRR